jgi:hypothetical protein
MRTTSPAAEASSQPDSASQDGNNRDAGRAADNAPEDSLVVHPQRSQHATGFLSRFRNHFLVAGFALLLSPLNLFWLGEAPVVDPPTTQS